MKYEVAIIRLKGKQAGERFLMANYGEALALRDWLISVFEQIGVSVIIQVTGPVDTSYEPAHIRKMRKLGITDA